MPHLTRVVDAEAVRNLSIAGAFAKAPSGGSLLLGGETKPWRRRSIFGDMLPAGNPFKDMAVPGGS